VTKAFERVKLDDVVAFTRQMATMITAGLPLSESLSILEIQSKPALSKVVGEILRDVQGGNTVADSMEKHRNVFTDVYISLVRAGEAAGALDRVLKRLASNLEKEKEFRAKTKGALIYPAIITIGMVIVAAIMMIFVVPKLASMYEDFDAELPLPTLILIGISNFVSSFWYLVIGMGVAFVIGLNYWKSTPAGRFQWDRIMLAMPVFGKLKTQIILAETTRTMSLLVGSGISLVEALEIVRGVIDNGVYREAIEQSMKNVKKGIPFSVTLARQGLFPPLLPNMVAVGEETGKMDEVLLKVSKYFEEEAEHMIKGLTTALEPLIMIVLGVGVGFLVISIIMPIYNLTNQF
jgi:type IV pilus assembly protein PilC